MRRLTKTDDAEVWLSRIERPFPFNSPFGDDDFALMLVVADPTITAAERAVVSEIIVAEGCRYAVCMGHECSRWDDSIDFAFISTSPDFSPPDERFVMTTWHEKESLVDVAEYLRWNTAFGDFVPRHFLALLLGGDDGTESEVCSAIVKVYGPNK